MLMQTELIITLFTALCIALCARFAHAMTPEQLKQANEAVISHETNPQKLIEAIKMVEGVAAQSPQKADDLTQLARLYFINALNESNKDARIEKYQKAIDTADKALALNPDDYVASFWKGAALGKQGLDRGIFKSLSNARTMEELMKRVVDKNEAFEQAGAHRALGRMYYKLPGRPISFGNNTKSLEHLKKAVELAPQHIGNHAFYAETLYSEGNKEEAKKQVEFVLNAPADENRAKENSEFLEIAKKIKNKLE